jgi:hypothetical protein
MSADRPVVPSKGLLWSLTLVAALGSFALGYWLDWIGLALGAGGVVWVVYWWLRPPADVFEDDWIELGVIGLVMPASAACLIGAAISLLF